MTVPHLAQSKMKPATEGQLVFRDANPPEDDELARILYNSFLPVWNHNWFQGLTSPLSIIMSTSSPLTRLQARRLAFYRSWLALVRIHCGVITLAYTASATDCERSFTTSDPQIFATSPSNSIAAVVLLLPPHARPSWFELLIAWRAGLLQSLFGLGLRGVWRICVAFERNVERMISRGLKLRNIAGGDQKNLVMCHGCVRNPQWEGRAPARKLFNWTIERWWERERDVGRSPTPVWLDTTIDEGVRAYQEIGFEVLGECAVDTGADAEGIKLGYEATEEVKNRAKRRSRQWVMLRVPPEHGKHDEAE